uniref:Glycoprotein hormone subunit beta domain-containing protein n=1 Tax=Neogobius melanostomus TaxID=47308 RepID=A0A8C6T657_9GOBI
MPTVIPLVVMAAMWVLVGAEHECGLTQCRLMTSNLEVESCGLREQVVTTVCAGYCYHQDPVYMSALYSPEQGVCTGEWHYEERLIQDCPVPARIPVAHSCTCGPCLTGHSDCERFSQDLPSCRFSRSE